MDYADAVLAFFSEPEDAVVPDVVSSPTPARRLRDAIEPIAMHDVWSPTVNAATAELGLNFLTSYVYGRGSALGGARGAVVAAAFAWFEPGAVAALHDSAAAEVPLDRLVEVREAAVAEGMARELAGEDVGPLADRLSAVVEELPPAGRPFFAGLAARGRPQDPYVRLWWACDALREHRGDSHVAASLAAGLDAVEANVMTERWLGMAPRSLVATRVWSPEQVEHAEEHLRRRGLLDGDALSEAGLALRLEVEASTDDQQAAVVEALGEDLPHLCDRLDGWAQTLVEAGCFPADRLKRAAG